MLKNLKYDDYGLNLEDKFTFNITLSFHNNNISKINLKISKYFYRYLNCSKP